MPPNPSVHLRAPLSLALGSLLLVSFLPLRYKQALHTRGYLHSPAHLIGFALLAYLALKVTHTLSQRSFAVFFLAILAVGIEVSQHRQIAEPMEWGDVLLDLAGLVLGCVLVLTERS